MRLMVAVIGLLSLILIMDQRSSFSAQENDYTLDELLNTPAALSPHVSVMRITPKDGLENIFKIKVDLPAEVKVENMLYQLSIFIDGRYSEGIKINLPYEMKRDFRGLVQGNHRLTFVVVDMGKKIGWVSEDLLVK